MPEKKYFSISEVCEICSLASHKLRYIDKMDNNISITKIRGRRYYTIENINYLKQEYSHKNNLTYRKSNTEETSNKKMIKRIDQLIKNFQSLSKHLIK